MITNKKKNEKTTEIYFDETPAPVVIRNLSLSISKERYPSSSSSVCLQSDGNFSAKASNRFFKAVLCVRIRLTAPYTEERKALARAKMIEINKKEEVI